MSRAADSQSSRSQASEVASAAGSQGAQGYATREGSALPRCGAETRGGHACRHVAGYGTPNVGAGRCKFHGGASPNGRKHAASEAAKIAAAELGVGIDTDPHTALEACVSLVAGQVAWLQARVAEIDKGKALEGGQLHPTLRALESSIDRWSRVAKTAADAGVNERRVQLDEMVVQRVGAAIFAGLAEVDLTPEQDQRLREAIGRRLAALDDPEPAALEVAA